MQQSKSDMQKYQREFDNKFVNWVYLFLIWPFGAMLGAFVNFRAKQAKTAVWFFCVFFGFVFVYASPTDGGADSARYASELIEMHENWYNFDYFKSMFYSEGGYVDIYQPLVTWIVAFFTGNPRWLFTAFAAVFGYFYTRNLWMIFSRISFFKRVDLVLAAFMIALALINPIWNINGVRMWTAAHVFLFGMLRYILDKDRKGSIWIFSSVLFHFSFFLPIVIFLVYLLVPKKPTIWILFFFLASFIRELNLEAVRNALSFLPDFLQSRVEGYTSGNYAARLGEAKETLAFHVRFSEIVLRWILYTWVVLVYVKGKAWLTSSKVISNLFVFGLFLGGFAQILSNMPSGGRFMNVVMFILFAVFVLFLAERDRNGTVSQLGYITMPFILFCIIFEIRLGFEYIGVSTIVSNPIVALFTEDSQPLINLVKSMF